MEKIVTLHLKIIFEKENRKAFCEVVVHPEDQCRYLKEISNDHNFNFAFLRLHLKDNKLLKMPLPFD